MKEFSRTWEKRIAWIANIIFVLWFMLFGYVVWILKEIPVVRGMLVFLPAIILKVIILFILAIVATLMIKRRIISGIMFLVIAIITVNFGFYLSVVAILYFIVAIMLFVRKEKNKE